MTEDRKPLSVPLSEVVDPDAFRTEVAAVELAALRDDQIIAAQLDDPDLGRARYILAKSGGLIPLTQMGLSDHRSLDLSATESARFLIMQGLAARLAERRLGARGGLTTAQELANEIGTRGLEFRDQEAIGVIGIDHRGIRTLDRVMYRGTASATLLNPRELVREALRMNAVLMVFWCWQPFPQAGYDAAMKHGVDELRLLGDVAGVRLWDAIVVGEAEALSVRTLEGWVN